LQKVKYPLNKKIYGRFRGSRYRNVYGKYVELKKSQWNSPKKIKELSWKRTKNILQYAYNNVPYYNDLFKEAKITPDDIKTQTDLVKIPITTKQDIKKNYPHKIISQKVSKQDWVPHSTSGSTGEPFEFAVDQDLIIGRGARDLIAYNWAQKNERDKIIIITGYRERKKFTKLFNRYIRQKINISAFDIHSTKHLDRYIKEIIKFSPKVLSGYTSSLTILAHHLKDHNTDFNEWLKSVIPTGETLSSSHRKLISSRLGPVFDRYGCREFGSIAGECDAHEGYHIHSESFFIEIVKNNEQLGYNESGNIVLTNLENLALPFIRYDMGDISKLKEDPCSCRRGLPLLSDVEGRIVSLIQTPSGKLFSVHFLTLLFEDYGNYFVQFQAVQKRKNSLDILIVPTSEINSKIVDSIQNQLTDYAGEDFSVQIKLVDSIPLGRTGKRELIRSEL
jgi:phenylacetate-CoA ligase